MKMVKLFLVSALLLFSVPVISACDDNDSALENAGESIEEAGEEIQDEVDDATDDR